MLESRMPGNSHVRFGGGHTEKGSNAPRWVPTLPLLWGKLSIMRMGTLGAVLPVEWVGHRDGGRGEARLLPVQPSRHGTGPARAVSKRECQWSPPSRWQAPGTHGGAT